MSSRVNVGPDYDDRMPTDPAEVGPRAAHLQTSAGGTHTHALSATGTRLVDSSVLNSLGWGLRPLDNDFVVDMLQVMNFGRDGGTSLDIVQICSASRPEYRSGDGITSDRR